MPERRVTVASSQAIRHACRDCCAPLRMAKTTDGRINAMKQPIHQLVALPLVMASALLLGACAHQPHAARAGQTELASKAAWPVQQCRFATQVDDWQTITQGLQAHNAGQQQVRVVRLQADGVKASPDIMARVLDLGQVQVRSAQANASISRVGIPNRLPEAWSRSSGDAAKDQAQRASNRLNGNGYFGDQVDLRFRFPAWEYAFALIDTTNADCARRSLVFFNAAGQLIHTVTLANTSHEAEFDALVKDFRHADQSVPAQLEPVQALDAQAPSVADAEVDLKAYHAAWNAIADVHQFNRVLRDFKLKREQSVRLGPTDKARALAPAAVEELLRSAVKEAIPIMVFVSNGGVIQVHGARIHNVRAVGDWLVVDDPDSYITINRAAVHSAWAIERAGVYSVDLFDGQAQLIASFFGVRSKDNPEPAPWINLVKRLPAQ